VNEELRALFEADQADRAEWPTADAGPPEGLNERDAVRRARVEELIDADVLADPLDYFHVAMVFQHGGDRAHYLRAHELALRGAELGCGPARWLAAAALDRWLMFGGHPQRYGTQYRVIGGRWELWRVDPETPDEDRAAWDVPPLAEAQRFAVEMNGGNA
jgi:hypothetical protein